MWRLLDPKIILFAKHAQHVAVIHFPIALFLMSALFDVLASVRKTDSFRKVAYYNLLGASISTIPTVLTGLLAWQLLYGIGTPKGIILFHLIAAGVTVILLWLLTVLRFRDRQRLNARPSKTYFVFAMVATIAIILTAHLGGILSGVTQIPTE